MEIIKINAQKLTPESFAPYGFVISSEGRTPDFSNERGTTGWEFPVEAGQVRMFLLETKYQGLEFTKLEKHTHVSQVFFPAGGSKAVLLVAKAKDNNSLPSVDNIKAFLLDGTVGYGLYKHTWHSLDRLPVSKPSTLWVMVTDHETQQEMPYVNSGKAKHTVEISTQEAFKAVIQVSVNI